LVEEKKKFDSEFLSYNLMWDAGKKIRTLRDKKNKYSNPFKLNGRSLTNQVPFLCYDIPALLYVLQDLIMPHYSHFLWCVYDRPNRVILFYHFFGIMCLLTLKNTTCLPSARRVRRYQREVIRIRK
jgi:hypothetical protein